MREESSVQEVKLKETDTRIETEIAALRTAIEASKVSLCNAGVFRATELWLRRPLCNTSSHLVREAVPFLHLATDVIP